MMGVDGVKQNQLMYISLDDLVPQDHLLRDIRKKVDFTFIYRNIMHNAISMNIYPLLEVVEVYW
jgi:hypothetical protein